MKPRQMEGKSSHNKFKSQIENVIVRATIKYNEHNEIYNGCSFQSKQIIAIKIILLIVLNAN